MISSTENSALASTPSGRKPDFFIVGNPKSGTTALYEMLRRHPQVYMPDLKETRYFSRDHPRTPPSTTHPETLEQYLALFNAATPEQVAGEASPQYLRSPVAAERIAQVVPHARVIAILREPACFVRSMHMELIRDHEETETDLARAIAYDEAADREERTRNSAGRRNPRYSVRYVEALRRYHAVFSPEQVLVLVYDDFRADNERVVRRVLHFLGVDDEGPIEALEAHSTVRVRSVRAVALLRSLYLGRGPVARATKSAIKALTPQPVRREGLSILHRRVLYGKPHASDEALMLELRRRFKGEVVALSEYLDRDLVTLWGYDRIA